MGRPIGKRYEHPDGEDRASVTPSRIRRLGREAQVQLIAQWFLSLYHDPSNETPYNGREGGFLYIHGGPYDAREQIEAEFSDYVDEDIIEAATDFVESDGTFEWAPGSNHPDQIAYDRDAEASLDDRYFDREGGFERSPVGSATIGEGGFYAAPWDKDARISPSEVRSLSPQRQEELIEHWFYQFFEALAADLPTGADRQDYPFDQRRTYKAGDAIFNEFVEIADPDAISAVIAKVQASGGANWGPGPYHPDRAGLVAGGRRALDPGKLGLPFGEPVTDPFGERDAIADHDQIDARIARGVRTSFGTTYERAVRRSTLAHATDLQVLLAKSGPSKAKHGGIGHNQPPSEIRLDAEHSEQLTEAVDTFSEELNAERRNQQPDVRKVSRAARAIQSIGKWVAQKLDMTLDTFLKSLAAALGTSAATAVTAAGLFGYEPVVRKAMELYQSVIDWLNAVVLPF